jgi:chromosome segregation ATPase
MIKPILNEAFADNGAHSHWEVIDGNNGKILWSEELATDGREELEKENTRLKEQINVYKLYNLSDKTNTYSISKSVVEKFRNRYTALQSKCTEKEKECEELKESASVKTFENMTARCNNYHDEIESYKKVISSQDSEIESLKQGLEELKAKINDLTMDNMTHEYNQAEAEKYFPEYKRQIEEPILEKLEELKAENERLKEKAWKYDSLNK